MPRLGVIGHLSRDVVAGAAPRIGGGPWHAGRAFRLAGADALIIATCGPEDEHAFRERLETLGLPVELAVRDVTTAFSLMYDGDGVRTMNVDAIGAPFRVEDLDVEWLQVAPLLRGDVVVPAGPQILFDAQGLVRRPQLGPLRLDADFDRDALRGVSMLKLAEEEAAIVGPVDVPEVIVTHGVRGATVNGVRVAADPVDADPTGAGDAFGAGYLAARASGAEPVEAARSACDLVTRMLSE
ncbi:MAG TPA: PfkB family carbohydrate kinase [Gaiellaceae bacterium]|nr:PfkB family carbohydrate kinase [Gaiellaceae bacterium]